MNQDSVSGIGINWFLLLLWLHHLFQEAADLRLPPLPHCIISELSFLFLLWCGDGWTGGWTGGCPALQDVAVGYGGLTGGASDSRKCSQVNLHVLLTTAVASSWIPQLQNSQSAQ